MRTALRSAAPCVTLDRAVTARRGTPSQTINYLVFSSIEYFSRRLFSQGIERRFVVTHHLWLFRTLLRQRTVFGKSLIERGRPWFEYLEHYVSKLQTPLSLAFAFVATHNHFVLDRGGKVFNQSAPIIKLPSNATEEDHLALLGLLNSSTACFWMKQVFHNKGSTVDEKGSASNHRCF